VEPTFGNPAFESLLVLGSCLAVSQQPVGTFGGFVTGTRRVSLDPFRTRLEATGLGIGGSNGALAGCMGGLSHELSKDRWEPRADQLSDQIEDPRLASLDGTVAPLGGEPTTVAVWVAIGPILGELSAFNSEIGAGRETIGGGFERTMGAV